MWMALGMGALSAGQGILGGLAASKAAKARNKAARERYKYRLELRKREWYQNLSIWGAQRNKYFLDLNENDLAAKRGYAQAQAGLNRMWEQAAQSNEGALIKYLQDHGKLTAAGRTGRSIARINTLDLGSLQRHVGRNQYKWIRGQEAYSQNVEDIRTQQISNRNQLMASVAFSPMPTLAPPPPVMEDESPMAGIMQGMLQGATSFMGNYVKSPLSSGGGGGIDKLSQFSIGSKVFGGNTNLGNASQYFSPGSRNIPFLGNWQSTPAYNIGKSLWNFDFNKPLDSLGDLYSAYSTPWKYEQSYFNR